MKDQLREYLCAIFGHSLIQKSYFGFHWCGRCNNEISRSYEPSPARDGAVLLNHDDCRFCRANYGKLSWKDRLLTPKPSWAVGKDAVSA